MTDRLQFWAITTFGNRYDSSMCSSVFTAIAIFAISRFKFLYLEWQYSLAWFFRFLHHDTPSAQILCNFWVSIKHSNVKAFNLYSSWLCQENAVKDTFVHSIEKIIVPLLSANTDEDKWIVFRFVTETHSCCFLQCSSDTIFLE